MTGLILAGALSSSSCSAQKQESTDSLSLISSGNVRSVVILADEAPAPLSDLAQEFVRTVKKATGAEIPVHRESESDSYPPEWIRIYLGNTRAATKEGFVSDALSDETYRIVVAKNRIFILSRNAFQENTSVPASQPIRWALNDLLENSLHVRWLWPGDLGTFIPKAQDFQIPVMDRTYQPRLLVRKLRKRPNPVKNSSPADAKVAREGVIWAENHQTGRRSSIAFGHAFEHWWEKYGAKHPDYFAETPSGIEQPFLGSRNVKLRLSNPAVIEQIAREYEEAGAPEYWSVCPNDRYGFDLSEGTRKWDIPDNLPVKKIWGGEANLTPRYVTFWNLVSERLQKINPKVKLTTYAYYAYNTPPPAERPLTARCVIGIVDSYHAFDTWLGWASTGSKLFLRPNWWHFGADAPFIPNKEMHAYLQFAWKHGMVGLDMDSILGYWSTQGISYYMVARLMTRPDLRACQEISVAFIVRFLA